MRCWRVLVCLGLLAACGGGGGAKVAASASSSSTTTTTSTTSTTTTSTTVAVTDTTAAAVVATTTTALDPCRNSTDPACGPLVWDPPLVNRPLTVTITADSPTISDGGTDHLTASVSDPDQEGPYCVVWFAWADESGDRTMVGSSGTCQRYANCVQPPPRYGTWDLPAHPGGAEDYGFDFGFGAGGSPKTYSAVYVEAVATSGVVQCATVNGAVPNPNDDGLFADTGTGDLTIPVA